MIGYPALVKPISFFGNETMYIDHLQECEEGSDQDEYTSQVDEPS